MEGYGIVSACFGMFGFIFALGALVKVTQLEAKLREAGGLDGPGAGAGD